MSSSHGPLLFQPDVPTWSIGQNIPNISGSAAFSAQDQSVRIFSQEYDQPQYQFDLTVYDTQSDTRMQAEDENPGFVFRILFQNHLHYKCNNCNTYLKTGQFILTHHTPGLDIFSLKARQHYLLFQLRMGQTFLQQMELKNPLLNTLLENAGQGRFSCLVKHPVNGGALLRFIIRDLMADGGNRQLVTRLVEEVLHAAAKNGSHTMSVFNIEQMYHASRLIEDNIKKRMEDIAGKKKNIQKLLTNKQLASEAHINERTLKRYYIKVFRMTPGRYAMYIRIREVQKLLRKEPELKMEVIAKMTGYASTATLDPAFKEITGLSPTEWKRSNGLL